MKKYLLAAALLSTSATFASTPEFSNLSNNDVEKVSNEFAMNFSHTAVAAPETTGAWGIEVGLIAGKTGSPQLKKVVDMAGEDGSDFKSIYHAGLMARAHFPYEIFLEASLLPQREISDVSVNAKTLGLGWNFGSYFHLPLDLAIGANVSSSEVGFKQTTTVLTTDDTNTKINVDSKTRVLYVAASKTFWFVTPYVKLGTAKSDSDVKINAANTTILQSRGSKADVSSSGSYWVVGANLEFFFFKLGLETSAQAGVKRTSAKFSLDF
jgi:hypothetical protein